MDLVITLCGDARESCPVVPARVYKQYWSLEDPARATGTEDEIMAYLVRDQVSERVRELVREYAK
ncbi:MAG: hypothetical protein AB1767_07275 [Bacillota bacterium]